jgi:hypothetical protein
MMIQYCPTVCRLSGISLMSEQSASAVTSESNNGNGAGRGAACQYHYSVDQCPRRSNRPSLGGHWSLEGSSMREDEQYSSTPINIFTCTEHGRTIHTGDAPQQHRHSRLSMAFLSLFPFLLNLANTMLKALSVSLSGRATVRGKRTAYQEQTEYQIERAVLPF